MEEEKIDPSIELDLKILKFKAFGTKALRISVLFLIVLFLVFLIYMAYRFHIDTIKYKLKNKSELVYNINNLT